MNNELMIMNDYCMKFWDTLYTTYTEQYLGMRFKPYYNKGLIELMLST